MVALLVAPTRSDMRRFWPKVDIGTPDDCWPWLGRTDRGGYGNFWFNGRNITSHRFAWLAWRGSIQDQLCVCHHCDNRPCCNPAHFFLGTTQENTADKVRKGRQARGSATRPETRSRGSRQHLSKLTEEQVAMMRSLSAAGTPVRVLVESFGVDKANVHRILNRETWAHVC